MTIARACRSPTRAFCRRLAGRWWIAQHPPGTPVGHRLIGAYSTHSECLASAWSGSRSTASAKPHLRDAGFGLDVLFGGRHKLSKLPGRRPSCPPSKRTRTDQPRRDPRILRCLPQAGSRTHLRDDAVCVRRRSRSDAPAPLDGRRRGRGPGGMDLAVPVSGRRNRGPGSLSLITRASGPAEQRFEGRWRVVSDAVRELSPPRPPASGVPLGGSAR